MKMLKSNQIGPVCSYCKNKAVFRQNGFGGKFACNNHSADLTDYERKEDERNSNLSEADYQSWMRV